MLQFCFPAGSGERIAYTLAMFGPGFLAKYGQLGDTMKAARAAEMLMLADKAKRSLRRVGDAMHAFGNKASECVTTINRRAIKPAVDLLKRVEVKWKWDQRYMNCDPFFLRLITPSVSLKSIPDLPPSKSGIALGYRDLFSKNGQLSRYKKIGPKVKSLIPFAQKVGAKYYEEWGGITPI